MKRKENLAVLLKEMDKYAYYNPRELNDKVSDFVNTVDKMDVDEAFKDETNIIAFSVIRLIIAYSILCTEIISAFDTAGWDLIFDKTKSTKHYLPNIWEIADLNKGRKS